jgi:lipid II:glycine glycyltransferase (peptidoglycan interpeptide bridge formation enzyme)
LLENWQLFDGLFPLKHLSDIVAVDLKNKIESIEKNFNSLTRRYIKKCIKNGLAVNFYPKPSAGQLRKFWQLYTQTMEKHRAAEKYFFGYEFIKQHFPRNGFLVNCCDKEQRLAACAIFLFDDNKNILTYHLGSTNYDFKISPLRFLIYKTIIFGQQHGFKVVNLGGGQQPDDSLMTFKKGFSRSTEKFVIGKIILNKPIYDKLCSVKSDVHFFPGYRTNNRLSLI